MRHFVELVLVDAMNDDILPLMGLIDYLMGECGYTPERLSKFARRRFGIPESVTLQTIGSFC